MNKISLTSLYFFVSLFYGDYICSKQPLVQSYHLENTNINPQETNFSTIEELDNYLHSKKVEDSGLEENIQFPTSNGTLLSKIFLPKNYSKTKRYPVVFILHGLVRTKKWKRSDRWWSGLKDDAFNNYIQIYPSAWTKNRWWQESQLKNIRYLYQHITNKYNVDSQKVYLLGVSDGGSGTFYINSRIPELFTATASVIGNPQVISQISNNIEGESYPLNYSNRPYLIIAAEDDQLYPEPLIKQYVDYFRVLGANIQYKTVKGRHNLKTYKKSIGDIKIFFESEEKDKIQQLIKFQTSIQSQYNKFDWLVVNKVNKTQQHQLFLGLLEQNIPSAIVEGKALPSENELIIKTYNIQSLTVLIPSNTFNLNKKLRIYVNDILQYDDFIKPSVGTALKWLDKSSSNTYYSQEINIEV